MFKNKYPLKVFAIISFAIILLTSIIVGVFGINTGIEFSGGSQIEIKLSYSENDTIVSGREKATEYVDGVKEVLKEHDCSIDSYFVEDKLIDTYLVIRIAETEIDGAETVANEIASKLNIDASNVSSVKTLKSYFTGKQVLFIGIAVAALLLICFFAGFARYGINAGVTLAFAGLHSLILSLALMFLWRVQLSVVSLAGAAIFAVITIFALVFILERVKENAGSTQYANLNSAEHLLLATKQNKHLAWIAIVVWTLIVVMLCMPINYVKLAAVSVLICLLVAVYTTLGVAPALCAYMQETFKQKQKQKLSKNVVNKK